MIASFAPHQAPQAASTTPVVAAAVVAAGAGQKAASSFFAALVEELTGVVPQAPVKTAPVQAPIQTQAPTQAPTQAEPLPVVAAETLPPAPRPPLPQQEKGAVVSIGETKPVRKAAVKPTVAASPQTEAPFAPVIVAAPIPPPAIPKAPAPPTPQTASVPVGHEPAPTPEPAPRIDTVLQVNIKTASAPVVEPPLVKQATSPEVPVTISAPVAAGPGAAVAPPVSASVPSHTQVPVSPRPTEQASTPAEPAEKPETPSQPLKSVTLEFAPDGARDIRLRVSERGGEVHISLHSSDASLSGKLHEGVHDLVGSLSKAGYEAQAWAPDQGRHQDHNDGSNRQQEERRHPSHQPEDPDAEEFNGVFEQQNLQEVS